MPHRARLLALVALTGMCACAGPPAPSPSAPLATRPPTPAATNAPEPPPTSAAPVPTLSAEPFADGEATCQNDAEGYAVSYPADWIVAPTDLGAEFPVRACAYFGPAPFNVDPSGGGEGQAWTIDVGVFAGGCLEFDLFRFPTELEDVIVAGYPAVRVVMTGGGYAYILNLRSDNGSSLVEPNDPTPPSSEECRGARGLMIAGREWGAVKGLPLRRIVDRMATTIEIIES